MLAPEALGFEACNRDQWDLRTFDLHERVGAISDTNSLSKDGKFYAPLGYQYRSLKQFSVWGEQPSPEDTERMMLEAEGDVYISASGYITKRVRDGGEVKDADEAEKSAEQKKEEKRLARQKEKDRKLAERAKGHESEEFNPLLEPVEACLRGACLDETWNPPPSTMPPIWMKGVAIAPAPTNPAPDRPLPLPAMKIGGGGGGAGSPWNSQTGFNNTKDTWGETSLRKGGVQRGGKAAGKGNQVKFSDV